ncbi:thermosome subunit [Halarchaeum sp. CBA1220]|uniref:thermosome subunit alpha n=1 Tax=Halarchaeum sp. CBA1220 TaxID=1853682 RepID=UPI000F3A9541|nr:thermosome subunit alpha [Halarchaeum sp. CBA1220]QLC33773.1 thermosome subunit [Halarchaeum sp. CBA1220]
MSYQGTSNPIFILGDDAQRTRGRDAQTSNIAAGKAVAEAVRTTLGPRGMDKMLVDSTGEVVITNDGVTILEEMDIEHPAAQMLVEVAQTQESEVGDGTTTASVLAGQLLAKAEDLLGRDVHPTAVVEGYAAARDIGTEAVRDLVLEGELDDDLLRTVAATSMTGKGTGDVNAEALADLVVRAVRHVETDAGANRDDVRVHTQVGAASSATELVEGIITDTEPVRDDMPRDLTDATVAVIDTKLETRETSADVEYNVTSVDQLNAALDAEESELRRYAAAVRDAGVDVLVSQKGIDDRVAAFLADAGVLALKSVKKSDVVAVANATGATVVGDVADIEAADLGTAERVHVERFGEDELTFIEGGADAAAVTLLVRGSTTHVLSELERAIGDAVDVVVVALDEEGVVPGAGCAEIVVADRIRSEAASIEGRAQLAADAFADALDALPRTLAENTGMDPIDALVDLRAANESGRAGLITSGERGEIADPVAHGVLDPAAVKREALASATDAATMIVRIDDIIAAE